MAVDHDVKPDSSPAENSASTPAETSAVAAAPSTDAKPAEPSPAKDESLLDRVKAAIGPKKEGSSPSQDSQEAKPNPEASPESDEKEPEGDPTEEELSRYHSKTRKRMQKLMTERNLALDKVKELSPHAEVGKRITSFLSDSGINAQEANLLLEIGRNMKRDPLKALEQLAPYYDALRQMAGDKLPSDLQEAVTKGEITETYARQLQRNRTQASVASQQVQARDAAETQRRQQEQIQQHAAAVGQTISTWEANQAKTDPDWNLKQSRIGEFIELEIRRSGYPKTAQAAVDMAEKAKNTVNTEIARFQPRKQAVASVNPASATRAMPAKPTTALEAAKLALAPA